MSFLNDIFAKLEGAGRTTVVQELRSQQPPFGQSGGDLLAMIAQARAFLNAHGLKSGDRCVLLAPNSIRWVAMDLAVMAEGMIVVPLIRAASPGRTRGHDERLFSGVDLLRRCDSA